ncbi:MAG: class I SAM-dependent rRNA methyltransferase [Anaerolineae bacterium]|nr:class I SAM-dependent rRNA methyltransferase [Anaerolineae bacterium]
MKRVVIKPARERTIRGRHPWLYSGGVKQLEGDPQPGDVVEVVSTHGEWLARGVYNPFSQMRVRVWTWDPDEPVDEDLISRRLHSAIDLRETVIPEAVTDACRLVHGESDGLPGVVVDRYGDWLVMQVLSFGAERWRQELGHALMHLIPNIKGIYERSDVEVRRLEGLELRTGMVQGEEPPEWITIREHGLRFQVDIRHGQKTGFYLDQRDNRQRVSELLAGKKVLNCFCYTGAFSVYAIRAGAQHVTSIDSSAEALDVGAKNLALNGFLDDRATWVSADVFSELRRMRDRRESYDAVILDPPKFAPTSAQVNKAARAYKDINLLGFKLLQPGGLLFTFSCSGGIDMALFEKIVAGAALDAGVHARIVGRLHQSADHPVGLNFPEGAYLKGLICQISRE